MLETVTCRGMGAWQALAWCVALSSLVLPLRSAEAAPKAKPRLAAPGKPHPKKAPPPAAEPSAPDEGAGGRAADKRASGDRAGDAGAVKAAGTSVTKGAPSAAAEAAVKETKESKEGVKTYKFGTIEVEGRLKSPQIIYFLRRVRAEFDAGLLGHRSFLRELSDTRNRSSLR